MKHVKSFQLFEKTKEENEEIIAKRVAQIEDKKTAQKEAKDKRTASLQQTVKTRQNEIVVKNRLAQIDAKKKAQAQKDK